ncbi:hypothetical protein BpHYR1_051775 [Brachionus plicatilis]|uniref:Uncharacterized protein n=1 Tax=Brachionus plicatilis TaxID=10195 RepID=A0A3M7R7G7_BRAPC|nr:hypothetical protein BpHYR1_051775 [Brachionus plicatilis]
MKPYKIAAKDNKSIFQISLSPFRRRKFLQKISKHLLFQAAFHFSCLENIQNPSKVLSPRLTSSLKGYSLNFGVATCFIRIFSLNLFSEEIN